MLLMCQHVSPSPELNIYLHSFIMRALLQADAASADLQLMARQCIVDVNRTMNAPQAQKGQVLMSIELLGYGPRKVRVHPQATLAEVQQLVSDQLSLTNGNDFAFFQVT